MGWRLQLWYKTVRKFSELPIYCQRQKFSPGNAVSGSIRSMQIFPGALSQYVPSLSVPGKVFAHVLLERLQPLLTRQRRPQQSGFTRTRSTIDAILAELHREFRKPLHVAYIDIKAAFDSVDRQALWKALHATGAPQFLIQLIQDLHTGTTSSV